MKTPTLADFLPPIKKMVEDDKSKILRLERELEHSKRSNDRLSMRCDELQSENFALKLQLNEFHQLENKPTRPSFPSFAEVSKPIPKTPHFSNPTNLKIFSPKPKPVQHFPPKKQIKIQNPSQIQNNKHDRKVSNDKIKPLLTESLPVLTPIFSDKPSPSPPPKIAPPQKGDYPNVSGSRSFGPKKSFFTPKQSKSEPQKVIVYHDSNLAWSLPSTVEQAVKNINTYGPHPIKDIKLTKNYTPRLEDTLNAVKSTNHSNSVVIISVMTNNAKAYQSIYQSKSLLSKIVEHLKEEVSVKNIIVLESPPSHNFNIFPYNKAMFDLCQNIGVFFARNLVKRVHLKPDGLHILTQYKHLMIKSVAAAIKKIDPKSHYHFPTNWYNS